MTCHSEFLHIPLDTDKILYFHPSSLHKCMQNYTPHQKVKSCIISCSFKSTLEPNLSQILFVLSATLQLKKIDRAETDYYKFVSCQNSNFVPKFLRNKSSSFSNKHFLTRKFSNNSPTDENLGRSMSNSITDLLLSVGIGQEQISQT